MFVHDVDINNMDAMNEYLYYLNTGNYSRAASLLGNSSIFFYGADLLNLLEDKLCELGNYLINTEKPKLTIYQSTEPDSLDIYQYWVGD
jgi:hypothetical protein